MSKLTCCAVLSALAAAAFAGTVAAAPVTLRASHQFPGGKGDVRDEMVQIIAREAKAAGVDLEIQVYPGASLFKPPEQWNALVNGQLDISSFPLDYASGKERAFGATLMPGLVRNHERAARLGDSKFMKEIKAKIEKAGVIVLSDAWLAGAIASKKACIRAPADIKGQKIRSAGPDIRCDVAGRGRIDRLHSKQRGVQRAANGGRRWNGHEHRQLRVVPTVRAGEMHHRAG